MGLPGTDFVLPPFPVPTEPGGTPNAFSDRCARGRPYVVVYSGEAVITWVMRSLFLDVGVKI